jgi:hypothetical protein
MIARVTSIKVKAGKLDEVKKIYENGIFPAAEMQKGYRNGYFLIDRKTNQCISVGFWDSQNEAVTDEQKGHLQERANMIKDLCSEPPVPGLYEVAVKD